MVEKKVGRKGKGGWMDRWRDGEVCVSLRIWVVRWGWDVGWEERSV